MCKDEGVKNAQMELLISSAQAYMDVNLAIVISVELQVISATRRPENVVVILELLDVTVLDRCSCITTQRCINLSTSTKTDRLQPELKFVTNSTNQFSLTSVKLVMPFSPSSKEKLQMMSTFKNHRSTD